MNRPPSTAVILAAGRGTRLGDTGQSRPKGFIQLGQKPIIEESLLKLRKAGVEQIIIVTGHCAEYYEDLRAGYDDLVTTVFNEHYADSGSMYSLCCAADRIDRDFLLLESDLIFEQRAIDILLRQDEADGVLLSGATGAGDEVYVATDDGVLTGMSKDPGTLNAPVTGELVGISRISTALLSLMLNESSTRFESTLELDYETDALTAAAAARPVYCPLIPDLLWAEIDSPDHLKRATEKVYPQIIARDGPV